jgi:integrase-like protein
MQSLLKKAKLPLHFTPHCLRHTYASILLADGVSPVYVQEQLGHATIELTVSTYGRWLKKQAAGAMQPGYITSGSIIILCGWSKRSRMRALPPPCAELKIGRISLRSKVVS